MYIFGVFFIAVKVCELCYESPSTIYNNMGSKSLSLVSSFFYAVSKVVLMNIGFQWLYTAQERIRWTTRVRACNYVKIKTGRNFQPILKIVTRTAQAA